MTGSVDRVDDVDDVVEVEVVGRVVVDVVLVDVAVDRVVLVVVLDELFIKEVVGIVVDADVFVDCTTFEEVNSTEATKESSIVDNCALTVPSIEIQVSV